MSLKSIIAVVVITTNIVLLHAETHTQSRQTPVEKVTKKQEKISADISVSRSAIALDIENREPMDTATSFPTEVKRLYCFTEIKNGAGHEIQHRWYWNDEMLSAISLQISSNRFRTHSIKTILPNMGGDWRVAIVDSKNESVLKMLKFNIK